MNVPDDRTIGDFGSQWSRFPDPSDSFHSSPEIFFDTLQGLYDPVDVGGKRVVEVGSGSGRVLEILRRFEPAELVGVEPSQNASVLSDRFADDPIVKIVQADGATPLAKKFDACFMIGVLHHIPQPMPVLVNVREMLEAEGVLVVWVYGREGRARIAVVAIRLLRLLTIRLPDGLLVLMSRWLATAVRWYGRLIVGLRWPRFPMREYLVNVFLPCSSEKQVEIIFDQLNPRCARYYSRKELYEQLLSAGFSEVKMAVRHGYSITAVAWR